jgi:hypothetical protein
MKKDYASESQDYRAFVALAQRIAPFDRGEKKRLLRLSTRFTLTLRIDREGSFDRCRCRGAKLAAFRVDGEKWQSRGAIEADHLGEFTRHRGLEMLQSRE